ncbi:MAG: RNA polymerase sigma factor [Planctomycetaceae bacterium]|nr:MAG: RNA polymerase sigma factor [Planctomycetaceae bacterium]
MRDVISLTDRELTQRCLRGHSEALQAFVRRFQNVVFAVCYRILGHREDAEDVSQEVFLRAFRSLAGFDSARPLQPWLLAIAVNRCRTYLSLRKNRPATIEIRDDTRDLRPLESDLDLGEELQLALKTLREEYRVCFILFHDQQLSLPEIASIVGSPVGTIKTWLHRARRQLAGHLLERGVAPMCHHELR